MNDKFKKALEGIRTELSKLPEDALNEFVKSLQRHSYSARLDAHHSVRSLLEFGGGSCSRTDLLVVSCRDTTDRSGKVVLPIHRLLCGATDEGLEDTLLELIQEPQFVATPLGADPVFATAVIRSTQAPSVSNSALVDRDGDIVQRALATIEVEVTTWKPDGTAATETSFSWICTVEAGRRIRFR
jgi:hypothetical protein